jgi:hypothetical protein
VNTSHSLPARAPFSFRVRRSCSGGRRASIARHGLVAVYRRFSSREELLAALNAQAYRSVDEVRRIGTTIAG